MRREDFPIGPFRDYENNPILKPEGRFSSKALYNPSVIKEGDRFYLFYRGESEDGLTGSIGMAVSEDGFQFTPFEEPVITPGESFDRGGCEDPRIVKLEEDYYLLYVGNSQRYYVSNICLAKSKDLLHWEKIGPVLTIRKGSWSSGQVKAGVIVPKRIHGYYVMYFMGEKEPWKTAIGVAYSKDLREWFEPLDRPVLNPRQGYFDSQGVEPGPTPLITKEGVLLVYNGWGEDTIYKPGGVLFSEEDPTLILKRTEEPLIPFLKDYGKEFGKPNHCVAEGLVKEKGKWLLYYGAADRVCCLAIYEDKER
ncbi:MAG: family 43 glycosylhydrolase [Thermodesulfobacteriota bacterium]